VHFRGVRHEPSAQADITFSVPRIHSPGKGRPQDKAAAPRAGCRRFVIHPENPPILAQLRENSPLRRGGPGPSESPAAGK
jgi:hypothetical protein